MDIFSEIRGYGISSIASRYGCEVDKTGRAFSPCPVCGSKTRHTKRKDVRPACIIVQGGNGWMCLQCEAKGDTVDLLARLVNQGRRPERPDEWRAVLSRWKEGVATLPLPAPRTSNLGHPGALQRPSYAEVMTLWGRSTGIPGEQDVDWLTKKFPHYTLKDIVDSGIVRFLPKHDRPEWWPWRHRYMAMLAFDQHGLVQSLHARMVGEPEEGKPKSRFPKGYSASGLMLCNKTATNWLRGKFPVKYVVIAEGLTSTLATTMALKKQDKWHWAVLGYTSGSHAAIKEIPWSNEEVLIFTDNDKAGNAYAERIASSLPSHIQPRRVTL